MVWADVIASTREDDGRYNSDDVDALHDYEQGIAVKYAVNQEERAGQKLDQPGRDAYAPSAFFDNQMMYLRDVCDGDENRSYPT